MNSGKDGLGYEWEIIIIIFIVQHCARTCMQNSQDVYACVCILHFEYSMYDVRVRGFKLRLKAPLGRLVPRTIVFGFHRLKHCRDIEIAFVRNTGDRFVVVRQSNSAKCRMPIALCPRVLYCFINTMLIENALRLLFISRLTFVENSTIFFCGSFSNLYVQ